MVVSIAIYAKNYNRVVIWHQQGYTPLHIASQESKFEIMQCLIEHRAQIDMQDNVSDQY